MRFARPHSDDGGFSRDVVFGDRIAGRTFIDIGSFHGDLCLEALRRGATRAVGVELLHENVSIARNKASQAGLSPEYMIADFERCGELGSFDVVACLNVLPQLFDPIHALRRMASMANERLVLELPDQRHGWFSRFRPRRPAIEVPLAERMHEVAARTFLPNVAAIEGIFNQHMATFEPIQITRSKETGSFLVVATKRRIKHLTVVAGPTKSGKSTFKNRLIGDRDFRLSLGLPEAVTAQAEANEIKRLPLGSLDHVVLHYDFFRPYDRPLGTYERDPAVEFFGLAEHLSIFTMMTPKARIRAQLAATKLKKKRKRRETKPRRKTLYMLYDSPEFLAGWYEKWFSFCATLHHARHTVVRNDGNYEFLNDGEWRGVHLRNYASDP
ncbi:MAG: methyltransferase domain-containing protein [Mesorhizobium sp.]|nr:MAG: methyltransferase domain-containing protein [Mesorhizobium sp.]